MPRVSVIIPTYDWSSALHFAVAGVLRQTLADLELWVVGDGCHDDSADVVAAFGDARVHWHNFESNRGSQAFANNWALERARGEWVAYCNHDDVWKPDHLERVVSGAESAGADLAYSLGILYYPDHRRISGLSGDEGLLQGDTIVPSTVIHRRALYNELGGWPTPEETPGAVDAAYFARLLGAGKRFVQVPAVTVFKFPASGRPGSYLRRDSREQAEITRRLLSEPHLVETELVEILRRAIDRPLGRVRAPTPPANVPAGWITELHLQIRGLRPEIAAMERLPAEVDDLALPWRLLRVPVSVAARERFAVEISLHNRTEFALASRPPHPVHWSYHWYDETGGLVPGESTRSALLEPLAPGAEAAYDLVVDAPAEPGRYRLRPALVQEDVRWFDLADLSGSSVVVEVGG